MITDFGNPYLKEKRISCALHNPTYSDSHNQRRAYTRISVSTILISRSTTKIAYR